MRSLAACLLILISIAYPALSQNISNPLLQHTNAPVPFDQVSSEIIEDATNEIIAATDEKIARITAVEPAQQSLANTLEALDDMGYELSDIIMKLGLIQATSPEAAIRNTANEQGNRLRLYGSNIYLNEPLYKALKNFQKNKGATLNVSQKKLLVETIEEFEKQGMKLSPDKRAELEAINKKVINLGSEFQKNIAESRDSIYFTEEQLKGVPRDEMNAWKQDDGRYLVYVTGPNYITIGENAEKSETRKTSYLHYNNRAYPKNIMVLDSLLYYRNVLANKLGFKSYAEYALVDKMAKKPSAVWAFQDDLLKKLAPHATEEIEVMKELKRKFQPDDGDSLYAWDVNYYTKKLKDTRFSLNTDEVKEYFEINNTIQGMFTVYEQLFNISIRKTSDVPVWDKKVLTYEIYNDGKKAGSFYLDLYPRQNKYTHFACFSIGQYRKTDSTEILPVASLVCNFPEAANGQQSLLPHREVITLFHEFGHLVHALLARPPLSAQGPFSVKRDFIEAPSQFLENWCWEYSSLKMLAKHYNTGAVLPQPLFEKMKKAQNVNIANFYTRQLYLGYVDMEFEDHYSKVQQEGLVNASRRLYSMNQIAYPEGSNFIASFGHLYGYAAGYYGYLWSRVYAQDMFSLFEKNGVMDKKTGVRYKTLVLQKGSSVPEMEMIRTFLGREPNSKAFLRSLGVE